VEAEAVFETKGDAVDEKAAKPVCAFLGCGVSVMVAVVPADFVGTDSSWGSGVLGVVV
jgi:hypothetical protein